MGEERWLRTLLSEGVRGLPEGSGSSARPYVQGHEEEGMADNG